MPDDLVGKLGIRLDYASQGLTGLMGIQVDPHYGQDKDDERLFIRVANLGNESIRLLSGDPVFNIEFHTVTGDLDPPPRSRESTWVRLQRNLANQTEASWTYVTRVESNLAAQGKELSNQLHFETENMRQSLR